MKYIKYISYFIVLTIFYVSLSACSEPHEATAESSALVARTSRLSELLGASETASFPLAITVREFRFPEDHGPHSAFRNEWWYVTGNLDGAGGQRYGYELTFFRFALGNADAAITTSSWRTNQVYIAHLALTDVAGERFLAAERYSRGAAGLAGAVGEPFRVWLDDWSLAADPRQQDGTDAWRLRAQDERFGLDLTLQPSKAPVLNGFEGLSQKSSQRGNASYYYSVPRIQTTGTLDIDGQAQSVSGSSWLDREWGSSALAQDQVGWDWFALQFDGNSELMFYQIRRDDGTPDIHSAGTWTDPSGNAMQLSRDQVVLEVNDFWHNARGDRYPAGWSIRIAAIGLDVQIRPVLADQELDATVRYWEGAVDVSGERNGIAINGRGYVELTGYAGP